MGESNFICTTCGTRYSRSEQPPATCAICEDERQYVRAGGQEWTTLERLRAEHVNRVEEVGDGLVGIGTEPAFAIAHPGVTSAILGPRTMEHLDDLLAGMDVTLTDEVLDRIDEIVPPPEHASQIPRGHR